MRTFMCLSERRVRVPLSAPRGVDDTKDTKRDPGSERERGAASPVPFCSFTTLQNRLLILPSGWGVCVLPASIIIMGCKHGAAPSGLLRSRCLELATRTFSLSPSLRSRPPTAPLCVAPWLIQERVNT